MRSLTGSRTRRLATARLEFSADRRFRAGLHVTAAAALIVVAVAVGARFYADGRAPAAKLADLQRQNAALQADLARVRTELELERSTRAALAGQIAELSQRSGELKSQVDFFKVQSGRSGRAR
jgi:cell division protein FtsB